MIAHLSRIVLLGAVATTFNSCKASKPIERVVHFMDLNLVLPAGADHAVSKNGLKLTIWMDDFPGSVVTVSRIPWPPKVKSVDEAYRALFKFHSKHMDKVLPKASLTGPPIYMETQTMVFFGASWRSVDGKMASITYSAHGTTMYMVIAVLPPSVSGSEESVNARKSMQQIVSSINLRERMKPDQIRLSRG